MKDFYRFPAALAAAALLLLATSAARAELKDKLSTARLDNGIELVMRPDSACPAAGIAVIIRNTGSAYENEFGGCGISHLCEHMVFKGAEQGTDSEIAARFHALGTEIGAFVDKHRTVFTVSGDGRAVPEAIRLLPSIIFENVFEQKAFDNEKKVILRELAMNRDDAARSLIDTVFATMFRRHPYRFPVGGHVGLFDSVTMEQAQDYYRRHYVPGNVIIAIAGGFDKKAADSAVREAFGHYPWRPFEKPNIETEPENYAPAEQNVCNPNIGTAHAALAWRTCDAFSPDMPPLDLLAAALGQGNDSVLVRKLKHEEQLVYSVDVLSYTPDYPGMFLVRINCAPENLDAARNRVMEIIADCRNSPPEEKKLRELKSEAVNSRHFRLQSAQAVAMEIGTGMAIAGNPLYTDDYLAAMARTDADGVMAAARKYLRPENLTRVTMLPAQTADKGRATEKAADSAPETAMGSLENGLRVAVTTNKRLPIVSAALVMRGGVCAEPEELAGISSLCATMLLRGTASRDMYEQERAVRVCAGSISDFSGYNSMGLTLNIPAADVETGLAVMADALLSPAFAPELFAHEKALQKEALKQIEEDIYQSALNRFRKIHFAGTPYSRLPQGTRESLEKIDRAAALDFLDARIDTRRMVLAFCGDITLERALALAQKHFGSLGAKTDAIAPQPPAVRQKRNGPATRSSDSTFAQSAVIIGFDAPGVLSDDNWPITLLDACLSGPSTPLFRKVRDESGAAYMVGSVYLPALDTGAFILYAGTTAQQSGLSAKKMLEAIEEIKSKPLAAELVGTTKNRTVGRNKTRLQNNSAIALSMALDELYGLGFDHYLSFAERIGALAPEDLRDAAARYFDDSGRTDVFLLGKSGDAGTDG